jgi:serine/threonine-protein kinase
MRSEEWQKVGELLEAALELEPGARLKLLDETCAGAPDLRREVESLLACEEKADGFLAAPALAFSADLFDAGGEEDHAGQEVGHYRILREIGRGGMGAVYLARRADDEYRKFVALKIVRRGMDTEDILRRFRNERQILASLDHPNIARLLDGGTTDAGLPYIVMEHVEGAPITDYCDRQRLTTRERLELFRTVCAAVQHAHQNLVVHRDLKPSNILVTAEGEPKLLDFGIAKVLNPELSALSMERTRTELRVLTPDYASPEQLRGEKLTTTSDVYSLGVVLYELLTGHRPYRAAGTSPHELERAIREEEPARPSAAVSRVEVVTSGDRGTQATITPESVSRARDTQPGALRRNLSGDLDNIILMAMRKEPSRRYSSVGQLAEDIRRHLAGLPVVARKDTFRYRAGKFVRRNKAGVAAAAVVLLSLVVGLAAALWQARVAAHERDRARVEAAKAERINAFLQHVLGYSQVNWLSPNPQSSTTFSTIAEALDEASRRAERELADQPEILAAVQFSLGQSYAAQGKTDVAMQHLRASLENRRRVLGPDHPDTAQSMTALGLQLVYQGKYAEAESLSREAVAVYRRARERGEANTKWFAISLSDLGISLISRGDAPAGEAALLEALEVAANFTGEERGGIGVIYGNLAISRGNQGDIDGAVDYLQKSVEEHRRVRSEPRVELAIGVGNLGSFLTIKGEYARAEPLLRESLDIYRKTVGEKHQFTTWSIDYLADNYCEQGDYRRALEEVNRALAIQREVLQEGHIDFARSWTILGKILTRTGQAVRGEDYLRRALTLRAKSLKPSHWRLCETQVALGENLTAQKRYAEAEPLLVESHDNLNASLSGRDPRTQAARRRLVALYEAWQKPDMAAQYAQP